jgi:hypothetical protein
MGMFDWLRPSKLQSAATPSDVSLASPWSPPGALNSVVLEDIWGAETPLPMTRDIAMTVPAVSRGRNLIVTQIMQYPLVALDENGPLADQPSWLYRTDGPVSPQERMAQTIDSGIFHGVALWQVKRGSVGQILDAAWMPHSLWRIGTTAVEFLEADGRWRIADDAEYILINFPFDGLLNIAQATIRGALNTERAWQGRMRNPIPLIELHATEQGMTQSEVDDYVKAWSQARTQENGAVGFTPSDIELNVHGNLAPDLFVEGRNAIRTDIANYLNIPTVMLDGSTATASLTYATTEGNRSRFLVESIPFFAAPVESALSMDACVPRGQRVRFDRSSDYIPTPVSTGTPTED